LPCSCCSFVLAPGGRAEPYDGNGHQDQDEKSAHCSPYNRTQRYSTSSTSSPTIPRARAARRAETRTPSRRLLINIRPHRPLCRTIKPTRRALPVQALKQQIRRTIRLSRYALTICSNISLTNNIVIRTSGEYNAVCCGGTAFKKVCGGGYSITDTAAVGCPGRGSAKDSGVVVANLGGYLSRREETGCGSGGYGAEDAEGGVVRGGRGRGWCLLWKEILRNKHSFVYKSRLGVR
jgi:hypothetical protein